MKRITVLAVCLLTVFSVLGCGSKAKTQEALRAYAQFRAATSGDDAGDRFNDLMSVLRKNKMDIGDISVNMTELKQHIQGRYVSDAVKTRNALFTKKDDPVGADKLRKDFYRMQELSGRPISAFRTSRKALDHQVALNHLGAARAQGVKLTPADYKRAGLPVPVIKIVQKEHKKKIARR